MSNSTTIQPLAATGLFPSLTLHGGTWTITTQGHDVGDYLLTAPGEMAEVVTVKVNAAGIKHYHCTCAFDLFDAGSLDYNACLHISLVNLFLNLRIEVLAGDLGRLVRAGRRLISKGAAPALIDQVTGRAGELAFWLHQRRAATIRHMPYRPAPQQTEGASVPSPAGWFALRPVAAAPAALQALVSELCGGTQFPLQQVA